MKAMILIVVAALCLTGCNTKPQMATSNRTVTVTRTATNPSESFIGSPPANAEDPPLTPVAPAPYVPPPPPVASGPTRDGTYIVGTDIQPGTYKSSPTLALNYPFCTWKRLSDLTGNMTAVIAIQNSAGPTFVTVEPSDTAFETLSCQPWQKVG